MIESNSSALIRKDISEDVVLRNMLIHELPIQMLKTAYYHPGHYGLFVGKRKIKVVKGESRIHALLNKWERVEDVIDFQLQAILIAFEPLVLGNIFAPLSDCSKEVGYRLMACNVPKKLNKVTGYPDIVLRGDNGHVLLIEIKVAPSGSRATKYKKEQYQKYMRLANNLIKTGQASKCSHLVIIPDSGYRYIAQWKEWGDKYDVISGKVSHTDILYPLYVRTWDDLLKSFTECLALSKKGGDDSAHKSLTNVVSNAKGVSVC
jgi:hypothetical protein